MPVAIPVSVDRTASTISLGITAKAKPMPTPQRMNHRAGCHGSAWNIAMPADPIATRTIPATSGPRWPYRAPTAPANGPAKRIDREVGSIHRPATVTEVPKP